MCRRLCRAGNTEQTQYGLHDRIKYHLFCSFLKLKVFYDSRTTMIVEDSPKYTIESILSNVGGAIGLYLGLSIVSVFEFLEVRTLDSSLENC